MSGSVASVTFQYETVPFRWRRAYRDSSYETGPYRNP
jgi:hypothetical protein